VLWVWDETDINLNSVLTSSYILNVAVASAREAFSLASIIRITLEKYDG
jgi:hypothetical protein